MDHRPIDNRKLLSLLLVLLLLLDTARYAKAQPSPPYDRSYNSFGGANFNSSTAVVIVVIVSAFFLLAFLSIYIRQCSIGRSASASAARDYAAGGGGWLSRRGATIGLDPTVLETFPTFVYSQVKGLKIGKGALECAVCLSEFSDDETLRLLPRCSHVFHSDCIDVWLASHATCPVCRTDLTAPDPDGAAEERSPLPDHVAISVNGEEASGEGRPEVIDPARIASEKREATPALLPRSHTTGHSVARQAEGCDRYTLRLPEHVRREIVAAVRLRRTASCVVFPAGGEASSRTGYRARSVRLGGQSDRWAPSFLARAFSVRVPAWAAGRRGEGEGSLKKGEAVDGSAKGIFSNVRSPFDCLGGGSSGGGGGARSNYASDEIESSTPAHTRV